MRLRQNVEYKQNPYPLAVKKDGIKVVLSTGIKRESFTVSALAAKPEQMNSWGERGKKVKPIKQTQS